MNITSVYLGNREVRVAVGTPGTKRVRLRLLCRTTLPEGCLINGVITNEHALAEHLQGFWEECGLPRKNVSLVIDSTQFVTKSVRLPSLPPKKTMALLPRELAGAEGRQEPLYDYMVLERDSVSKTDTLLCSMAERALIGSFVDFFQGLGMGICGLNVALACELKLIGFLPVFRQRTAIVLLFDGDNLLATLVEDGRYKYSSRARLFGEHGTEALGVEVTRTVSGTLQFQASDKSGFAITDVYFAGCSDEDYEICAEGVRSLGLAAGWLPDDPLVELPVGGRLCEYVCNIGNLIRR